jgi:ankyrin repeat protein
MTRSSLLVLAVCLALAPGQLRGEQASQAARKTAAAAELERQNVAASPANLRWAAMRGDAALVQLLLDAGVDPNLKFQDLPQSILSLASVTSCTRRADPTGRDAVIAALLAGGADPNAVDIGEVPLFVYVAQQCPASVVEAFIAAGARLDARSPQGFTPLSMALVVRNLDAAETLIDHGARLSPQVVKKLFPETPADARLAALVERARETTGK